MSPPKARPTTDEQQAVLDEIRDAARAAKAEIERRDLAIRRASTLGATRRVVANAAEISAARVQQIIDG